LPGGSRGEKIIIEDTNGAPGTILTGPSAGCSVVTENLPAAVGYIGKDAKTLSIFHEGLQVETGVTTCPDERVFRTPRICYRERLLRKM
jgi:hypothetical protein